MEITDWLKRLKRHKIGDFTYDPSAKAAYFRLVPADEDLDLNIQIETREQPQARVLVDYHDGKLVGIEILGVELDP